MIRPFPGELVHGNYPDRAGLAAGNHRREGAQSRQALGHAAGGAHRLPRLRPHFRGGAPGHRRLPGQARLRHAGRIPRGLRRRPAQAGRGSDLPLPGRPEAVVRHPADGHQAGRGPGRATGRQPRHGRQGAGGAAEEGPAQHRGLRIASTPCPARERTCRTTSTRGWWCSPRSISVRGNRAMPRRRRPGKFWSRAAVRRGCSATPWSSWRWTRCGTRTSTSPSAGTWPSSTASGCPCPALADAPFVVGFFCPAPVASRRCRA